MEKGERGGACGGKMDRGKVIVGYLLGRKHSESVISKSEKSV